ncbi:hypothetical protein FOZ62_008393, partial [Perkinsus olseni]
DNDDKSTELMDGVLRQRYYQDQEKGSAAAAVVVADLGTHRWDGDDGELHPTLNEWQQQQQPTLNEWQQQQKEEEELGNIASRRMMMIRVYEQQPKHHWKGHLCNTINTISKPISDRLSPEEVLEVHLMVHLLPLEEGDLTM